MQFSPQPGRSRFGAPFNKEHESIFDEFANTVFENQSAVALQVIVSKYLPKKAEGKPPLFLTRTNTKPRFLTISESGN
jgi:hypothetical protein